MSVPLRYYGACDRMTGLNIHVHMSVCVYIIGTWLAGPAITTRAHLRRRTSQRLINNNNTAAVADKNIPTLEILVPVKIIRESGLPLATDCDGRHFTTHTRNCIV